MARKANYGACGVVGATLRGVEAVLVSVKVAVEDGLPGFQISGTVDASVMESRERVKAALRSCGFTLPDGRVTVNLSPGIIRKTGSAFDLPIAVGVLVASGQVPRETAEGSLFFGELSMEGEVRRAPGILSCAIAAREAGLALACAPASETGFVKGLERRFVKSVSCLREGLTAESSSGIEQAGAPMPDFGDIGGFGRAKRAFQVAAAGGHGIAVVGSAGPARSALAACMPSILPPIDGDVALQAATIHSAAGLDARPILDGARPFRSVRSIVSLPGLLGGGLPLRPGEASLAHGGVLYLDGVEAFEPATLAALSHPAKTGRIELVRPDGNVAMPASFLMVAGVSPCPCGRHGDRGGRCCACPAPAVEMYRDRVLRPVGGILDIRVDMPGADSDATGRTASSEELREGVLRAREFAAWRSKGRAKGEDAEPHALRNLGQLVGSRDPNGRRLHRAMRLARTIADMEERERVDSRHVIEAAALALDW